MRLLRLLPMLCLCLPPAGTAQVVTPPVIEPAPPALTTGGLTASLTPSTVSLTLTSALTLFYGEPVDGLAQVTAYDGSTVTGTVTFRDGAQVFCTLQLANGANCPESASTGFAAGTHVLTAVYSGDATHEGATSNAVTVTVQQDGTTTALASSTNPVAAGGSVLFAAVVQGQHGQAAGSLHFMDGDAVMGTATLDSSGKATLSATMLAAGTHAVTAVYTGNANSAASTSEILQQVVTAPQASSTTTLQTNATTLTYGQSATLVAQVAVSSGSATGSVRLLDGGNVIGGSALDGAGRASFTVSTLAVGTHSLLAQYSGDANAAPSLSSPLILTVQAAPDGILTLGLSSVTIAAGQTAVLPVTTSSGASVSAKSVSVSCSGLPDEASCSYAGGTVRIQTAGPRDCNATTPYGVADLPFASPVLACLVVLLLPRKGLRHRLLMLLAALLILPAAGCGIGNCTDLGSRPGTYNVAVSLNGAVQKVVLIVKP